MLILLDLSAAFNTVDHAVLLDHLKTSVSIKDTAFSWFYSYLLDRTFSVTTGNYSSTTTPITCCVPQSCILGPFLFSIHMLPLGQIIKHHNESLHSYADDTQIYLPLRPGDLGSLTAILDY